jgi:release factor glutamine methyltransferase
MAGTPAREALDSAVVALSAAGVDTPRLDAEVLLAHVLGVDRGALVVDRDRPVEGDAVRAFQNAVRRRAFDREPVAYITGTKGFRHLDLQVDRRVLIPRPETETLVEAVVEILPQGARVHDLGTGSGAIALALKDERPDLVVSGSDVSKQAIAVARANAERLGLDVEFRRASWMSGAPPEFDAVVSNPPYVAERERPTLAPEIVRHEPAVALFAGEDGLDAYRTIARIMKLLVRAGTDVRTVALEVGHGQAATVEEMLVAAGLPHSERRADLAGIDRVVVAWR